MIGRITPWDAADRVMFASVWRQSVIEAASKRSHRNRWYLFADAYLKPKGRLIQCESPDSYLSVSRVWRWWREEGRGLDDWRGGEMTRGAQGLLAVYPASLVEISLEIGSRLTGRG